MQSYENYVRPEPTDNLYQVHRVINILSRELLSAFEGFTLHVNGSVAKICLCEGKLLATLYISIAFYLTICQLYKQIGVGIYTNLKLKLDASQNLLISDINENS